MRAAASLRLRLLLGAALWIGIALLVAWFAVGALLRGTLERAFDARLEAVVLSLLAGVEVAADGAIALDRPLADPAFARALSGWYWQVADGATVRLRSRSLWTDALAVPPVAATGGRVQSEAVGPDGRRLRVLSRTVTVPGSAQPLTFVVAGPQDAIDAEAAGIGRTMAIALAVLGRGWRPPSSCRRRSGWRPSAASAGSWPRSAAAAASGSTTAPSRRWRRWCAR